MADLKDARLIYLKGILFLLSGCLASSLLLIEHPSLKTALLLGLAIWCSARFYYFAFYVIEHYVDANFASLAFGRLSVMRSVEIKSQPTMTKKIWASRARHKTLNQPIPSALTLIFPKTVHERSLRTP